MEVVPTLKEVLESGNDLTSTISRHPAILQDEILKKGDSVEMMDLDNGDLLDQIDMANKLVAEVDDRIKQIYKSVRASYSSRFPELTDRVTNPMQYILTAQLLRNKPERITEDEIKSQLSEVLEPKMHLLVTMTAATTQGVKLEPEIMTNILKACAVATYLANLRTKLLSFVELNMATIAPNLSVIVGAPIAAKLMGLAGGLTQLATMPSCNVPILGSHRVSNIESNINAPSRVGVIYDCDLIQQIPSDHTKDVRKRAVRWVANKCVLAARCDAKQTDLNGSSGKMFREKIESLINKDLEPPPKKAPRPLPAPIEKSGKKRGGKRVRRMKERYAQTELRKAANRMNFGDVGDDAYQNDLGFGRSQLHAIQKLRGPQINEKTKIRLSKSAQKKLAKAQAQAQAQSHSAQAGTSGTNIKQGKSGEGSSTIIFTPQQQGLEIYNPKAVESYTAGTSGESSNYFSNTAGFFVTKKENQS